MYIFVWNKCVQSQGEETVNTDLFIFLLYLNNCCGILREINTNFNSMWLCVLKVRKEYL